MGLALSRHAQEKVDIDRGRVIVTVVKIEGSKVVLHFEADRSIPIMRAELLKDEYEEERRCDGETQANGT